MKLHCEKCALLDPTSGEYRIGDHSEIAVVNVEKLDLPFEVSMFESLNAERELPVPWVPGVTWDTMMCPRNRLHSIFVPWEGRMELAAEEGGVAMILTDAGWHPVKKDIPEEKMEISRTDKIKNMREAGFTNKKIAKRFNISRSRVSQIINKVKHEKETIEDKS
jgi:hypothetical protein